MRLSGEEWRVLLSFAALVALLVLTGVVSAWMGEGL